MARMSNNSNDYTQKDLMNHLLNAAHSSVRYDALKDMEINLNNRIDKVRDELKHDISELKQEINCTRIELKQEIANARVEQKQDIADVRVEVSDLRTEFKELRNKMDRMTWTICGTIIVTAVTVIFKDVLLAGLIS